MPRPWPIGPATREERAAYADASVRPYWSSTVAPRAPDAPAEGRLEASLCIVGGGFSGLWAALHAKADNPARDVLLLEAGEIGGAASGRNGGFCIASLTHGTGNGASRFPEEIGLLERLGRENYDGLLADLATHGIDCDLEPTGELIVGLSPSALEALAHDAAEMREHGYDIALLSQEELRASVHSPTYAGGAWCRDHAAILNPAKLVAGLRRAALRAGVRIHEGSPVAGLRAIGKAAIELDIAPAGAAPGATVVAERVLLLTGAHRSHARAVRQRIAAVYDYALMTEPLSAEQLASIGWADRQGIGDAANQFHYYRLSADNRILWGGYDAVYRYGGPVDARYDAREATFARLSQHFFTTFPQLRGLRFTHRWGGAIDTCSRFSVFFGTSHGGRVAYAGGYTGLGVCASRFGGRVALDLVDGAATDATRSRYVQSLPFPFPPEPLRYGAIQVTKRLMEQADAADGERGLALRGLDRLGLGFDS